MNEQQLTDHFTQYFSLKLADTEELRQQAYRVRYDVYCEELAFEDKSQYPEKMEFDEFDAYSDHLLLVHKSSGLNVGTVRLVQPSVSSAVEQLPLEKFAGHAFDRDIFDLKALRDKKRCEVSRLAVSKHFRRRSGEQSVPFTTEGVDVLFTDAELRNFPYITVSLYLGVAAIFELKKHEYSMVMMEPRLARRVSRLGIMWRAAGEAIEYHGLRAPFYITRDILLNNMKPGVRGLYEELKGQLKPQLGLD
ncbi:PEP-CTERM/exosortase system-associated acyltransferase [Motiliproteus coralliicola]|nr:PEP-CTERM/exosortase system-associated acyltransferase [Motiliproteus coralliicola]